MMNNTTQELLPTAWSLEDLLATPLEDSMDALLADLDGSITSFEVNRELLSDTIGHDEFRSILRQYEHILELGYRAYAYAHLFFFSDVKNQAALILRDRVDQAVTAADNRTLFFTLWLKSLTPEIVTRLAPEGDNRHYLNNLLKFKPYTLGESEEQIINLKDTNGINAIVSLYDMITNGFTFTVEVEGERRTLTRDQVSALYRHPSPDVRAAAYQELFRVYEDNSAVLAQMYSHRVRDWHSESLLLRHYPTAISARNLANDIPDNVVDVLLGVCADNNDLFQRYFKLKAGWLGVKRLRRYDIYSPLTTADKTFEYAQALDLIMDSLRHFSPAVADMAWRIVTDNHIDAEIRPGKRGGAFCYSVLPGMTPWVHVNYTGKARDVATLAHELGHGIHGILSANHSLLTYHPSLPLAETASVFSEMLLTERLLSQETDVAVRRDLLAYAVDDAYATVQRQSYFTLFEREAHDLIMAGKSADDLCVAYLKNLQTQFGEAVDLSDDFRWEWISIPHIYHTPFYTYAYSFGQLLVLSLYSQYRVDGESFIPRYLNLLSYGGAEEPAKVLNEAGFDIAAPSFWQGGYDVLRDMIDELENLHA
ncbi:MAG: M3 family oligoendopeptidase [Candidatus Promineofilum sp.]|uniref:M3 family oligoendopeptidase n=1 Tax=Promineifilum sp. TaxID=2664178 RepID=UPI0024120185|nr:M3 family oligoendopeptidase [Promineifilum sp.]